MLQTSVGTQNTCHINTQHHFTGYKCTGALSLTCRLYFQHLPQGPPFLLLVLAQVPGAEDSDMKATDEDNHMVVKTFGFIIKYWLVKYWLVKYWLVEYWLVKYWLVESVEDSA